MSTKTEGFREQLKALRYLPPYLRLIWDTHKGYALSSTLLRLVRALIPLASLYTAKLIVDEVVALVKAPEHPMDWLWTLVAIELGLELLSDLLGRLVSMIDGLLGDKVGMRTSMALMRHAATLDLYQFENAAYYDKLERARQNTYGRSALLSTISAQVQSVITLVSLAIGLTAYNPWLLLIFALATLPLFLGEIKFNREMYLLWRSHTPERRELDYLRYLGASDVSAKEVKLFGLSQYLIDRFEQLNLKYFKLNRQLALRRTAWGLGLTAIGTLSYYGAYAFILGQTVQGLLSIGTMTFLAASFQRMRGLLEQLVVNFARVAEHALYLQDYFDFMALQPQLQAHAESMPPPAIWQQGLVFENVGFQYPGQEQWVLRHLNFTLAPGQKLALVGENGAGKTTLVKLIARLYDPTEGRILLDGKDLRDYDPDAWQKQIGVIFQDFFRYHFSAADNIATGDISQRSTPGAITQAARKSLADQVIEQLPQGYDTLLGKRFEGGVDLSGGQWQKVALGRAYLRTARLLILDEPTAALDARAEYEVFQRFAELMTDKSAVIISHRFSTVRMADSILVLEHGRVIEQGSHASLMELNGRYAELFALQAEGYL